MAFHDDKGKEVTVCAERFRFGVKSRRPKRQPKVINAIYSNPRQSNV